MHRKKNPTLHLTLRQLQIFAAVARAGSTTAAAREIALSQSATSAALNELEALLGGKLFNRVGRHLVLNEHGRSMLPPTAPSGVDDGGEHPWPMCFWQRTTYRTDNAPPRSQLREHQGAVSFGAEQRKRTTRGVARVH